jgi:2-oxoisovalerate dehydrogenase E2 component (dihydrolipoyl transacylase)
MDKQFLLPDLGEGLTEAEIVSWLVAPGDTVAVDQLVVEVESAKSIVELPSPFAGIVGELHAAQGSVVHKGEPLLTVVVETAEQERVLVGYGASEPTRRVARVAGGRFHRSVPSDARHSPVISPIVRKRARAFGIDASQLVGTGPGDVVLRSDVETAISGLDAPAPTEGDLRIPIAGMRKVIAARLSQSRRTIPEATIWLDVDATPLFEARDRLQAATGERYSLTTLIARFAVSGLARYPLLNSSVDEERQEIVQHRAINLGLAAQTTRGLMVPVIHDAGSLSLSQLRDRVSDVVAHSETGDYAPAELSGGTFTVNNYGGFGVDGSAAIINYPEVAMLGIGRVIDRPWVVDGGLAVRKVVVLSFVFDHRVCDGDVASGFLTFVARCIEEPLRLLVDA